MPCCGGSARNVNHGSGPTLFEYSGEKPMTLFGRVTGVRYHFPGPGARVPVDARDAPAFEVVEGLDAVKPVVPSS
jgi:hypothetical protein